MELQNKTTFIYLRDMFYSHSKTHTHKKKIPVLDLLFLHSKGVCVCVFLLSFNQSLLCLKFHQNASSHLKDRFIIVEKQKKMLLIVCCVKMLACHTDIYMYFIYYHNI